MEIESLNVKNNSNTYNLVIKPSRPLLLGFPPMPFKMKLEYNRGQINFLNELFCGHILKCFRDRLLQAFENCTKH